MILLPEPFIDQMQRQLGSDYAAFEAAMQQTPPTSVRLNRDKCPTLPASLGEAEAPVPWCADGYYLEQRPRFTLDPLLHAGAYYVQEASSMYLQRVLEQYVSPSSVILDLCAAPGGKSTLLSEYVGKQGLLVANEVVRQRVFILSENIQKWGNGNTVVTHNQAKDFGERAVNMFDCIVVDAPCSGEGMFRKDPQAIEEWSTDNVQMCATRQRKILREVWDALRPDGILIYSTCTYNKQEDDDNVQWIARSLGADLLPLEHNHFYPHQQRGEGFFISVLRKHSSPYRSFSCKESKTEPLTADAKALYHWLTDADYWRLVLADRFVYAAPKSYYATVQWLTKHFTCISYGIAVAELRGKYYSPLHGLSMAKSCNKYAFPIIEVDMDTALAYLRTEAIQLAGAPTGILLLTYQEHPLGFAKNVGNRCNNLYPYEWRIRKL